MTHIQLKVTQLRNSDSWHAPFRPKTTHLFTHAGLTLQEGRLWQPSTRFPSPRKRFISTSAYPWDQPAEPHMHQANGKDKLGRAFVHM